MKAGQHLVGHGGAENNQELTKLLQAANRHPRMKELYLQDLRGWRESGGELMCVFSSMGNYSKWGSWGVLENGTQETKQAPKYQSLLEFLGEKRECLKCRRPVKIIGMPCWLQAAITSSSFTLPPG